MAQKLNIAIRVDAGKVIGSGHVYRCSTIAKKLLRAGHSVHFICREHPSHLMAYLQTEGFSVYSLGPASLTATALDYPSWLGAPAQEDAQKTASFLGAQTDLLLADHYGVDAQWSAVLRKHTRKIAIVDDLANRPHDCDLLLDTVPRRKESYQNWVPAHCRTLIGPAYALLPEAFLQARQNKVPPRTGVIKKILVFFGAADQNNETLKFLRAVQRNSQNLALEIKVILGQMNVHTSSVAEIARQMKSVTVVPPVKDMVAEILHADFFVGAAGVTTWERCCLGLPSVALAVAENQVDQARLAQQLGLMDYLGRSEEVTDRHWDRFLIERLPQSEAWRKQSELGMAQVDGRGADRFTEELQQLFK